MRARGGTRATCDAGLLLTLEEVHGREVVEHAVAVRAQVLRRRAAAAARLAAGRQARQAELDGRRALCAGDAHREDLLQADRARRHALDVQHGGRRRAVGRGVLLHVGGGGKGEGGGASGRVGRVCGLSPSSLVKLPTPPELSARALRSSEDRCDIFAGEARAEIGTEERELRK
jgi:hypothetical protein